MSLSDKTAEYWIVLCASMLFVVLQRRSDTILERVAIAAVSGGLSFAFAPELVERDILGEGAATAITTALSYAILDTTVALVRDRRAIMEIVRARLGGGA